MPLHPTRHALLRDRAEWRCARDGLLPDVAGALALARVPGPADGRAVLIDVPLPYTRDPSGIVCGPHGAVFVADAVSHRVLFVDGACGAQASLAADDPRGVALAPWALLVAEPSAHQVRHFARPALEPNVAYAHWAAPMSVAVDSVGRVVVVDTDGKRLHRVDERGLVDAAFGAAVQASGWLSDPLWVAVAGGDRVLVSDRSANRVFMFDAEGQPLAALDGPAGWQPGALAALGTRLYVADAAEGGLHAFELVEGGAPHRLGRVPGWSGPVSALALSQQGDLFVKPGQDATYHVLAADLGTVPQGSLHAGPFDAGEGEDWERLWVDVSVPDGAQCVLEAATAAVPAPPPVPAAWHRLDGHDALLAVLSPGTGAAPAGQRRFLWLRLAMSVGTAQASPVLRQVRAATAAEDYLDHLPQTYRRHDQRADGREGFLSRLLKLLRTGNGAIEAALDELPRIADPRFVEAADLPWLARWLALELPQVADAGERRALIARAVQLFDRRGTPASIAEFVALHTGIRPTLVEAFEHRHVWMLGVSSRLGFDTQLPPLDPLGWVVPETEPDTACCEGDAAAGVPSPCCAQADAADDDSLPSESTLGRAVVGEGGPLAPHQLGLPLFSEDALRFCVLVDAYRVCQPGLLDEVRRIVDREKPACTDYRVQLLQPELLVGLQSRVGVDAIVGGAPPPWRLDSPGGAVLGSGAALAPFDNASRLSDLVLGSHPGGGITLS